MKCFASSYTSGKISLSNIRHEVLKHHTTVIFQCIPIRTLEFIVSLERFPVSDTGKPHQGLLLF